jgi:hypothetical protein
MIVEPSAKINRNPSDLRQSLGRKKAAETVSGRRFCWLAAVLAIALCQSSSAQQTNNSSNLRKKDAADQKEQPLIALGRIDDNRIVESSGVVSARPDPDGKPSNAIWTFNDSGGAPILFRVGVKGKTQATLRLNAVTNRDWETMCNFSVEQKRFLAIGDVGDNSFNRKSYQIYVCEEPIVKPKKLKKKKKRKIRDLETEVRTIDFKYEDGNHNCEAMSYNAEDNTFWFVEKVYVDDKRTTAPGFYVLPDPASVKSDPNKEGETKDKENIARRVGDFPVRNVTGMAFSPNGQRLVIRSYFGAWLYEKQVGEKQKGKTWLETITQTKPKMLALPLQSQGEAICFSPDSESLWVTSEMKNSIIWQVSLDQKSEKE